MSRRGMLTFIVLNVLITIGVAYGVISMLSDEGSPQTERLVTFEVIITATPDPDAAAMVQVVTATFEPGRAPIPADVLDGGAGDAAAVPTIDPALIGPDGRIDAAAAVAALPENCIVHTVADGEYPSLIATIYDVNMFTLMAVNGLDEVRATNLQIGDELIVPLEGCPVEAFIQEAAAAADDPEAIDEVDGDDPEATEEVDARPTVTLAPTAASAQVEIVEVIGAGDITTEAVVLRNTGQLVEISGWTLSDAEGNTFTFPDGRRLFSGGSVSVNTRAGDDNPPLVYFWGVDEALFGDRNSVVVLSNAQDQVQATLRLSDLLDLP
jgi:hypothetical protein